MNPTRWAFLYHGIQRNELQQMEIFQATLARAYGLNLFPVKDEETGKLRLPEKFAEMTPLVLAASPEYLKTLPQLWDDMEKQDRSESLVGEVGMVPIELDTDTGMEILDKPINMSRLSEAERRQILSSAGILPTKPPAIFEEEESPKSKKRGSFSLDD